MKTEELRLALRLGVGHPEGQHEEGQRLEVHLLGLRQGVRGAGRRAARLVAGPGRQAGLDLREPRLPQGRRRRSPSRPRRPSRPPTRTTRACSRGRRIGIQFVDIPEFPDLGTQVVQDVSCGDRRADQPSTRPWTRARSSPRTSPSATRHERSSEHRDHDRRGRADRATDAATGRRSSRKAARLGPPGAAAARPDLHDRRDPAAVRGTLVISFMNWNAYYPDERGFAGLRQLRVGSSPTPTPAAPSSSRSCSPSSVVLISLVLGLGIALLLDRKFRGRGVVRTMMITPFLIVPVAAALLWKHALYNPEYGLLQRRAHAGSSARTPRSRTGSATSRCWRSSSPWSGSGRRS